MPIKIHMPYEVAYNPIHYFPGKQLLWFNSSIVGELITSMNLTPFNIRGVPATKVGAEPKAGERASVAIRAVELNGTHGGIKALHLHFNDQIYLLTNKQWAEISTKILADVKAKLEKVHQIGFEEGIVLGSMFEG